MAALLAVFCIVAPYANLPLQHVTAFIPVYGTALAIVDLMVAALVLSQFWVVRWNWLLVLACGFVFNALTVVAFVLTFPEAFAPTGLLGAGLKTAAWLSVVWHLGLPLVLVGAILARN